MNSAARRRYEPGIFYPQVMPGVQQEVLRESSRIFTEHGFYLGGGTATAIQLGHRRSVDFDWFSSSSFGDPLVLAARLRADGIALEIGDVARGTVHGSLAGVRISLLEYPYATLNDPLLWPEFDCHLASLADLACMKLSAITSRGARKDFVDLYALVTAYQTLPQLLRTYQRRYKVDDIGHVMYALSYFDDAEREPMPEMLWDVSWMTMRRAIESWVVHGGF